MPVPLLAQGFYEGFSTIPYFEQILSIVLRVAPWAVLIYLLKWYFGGAVNRSERNMHSKVVMMTGGTSGIGAEVARELANRGAQLVLLTQHPLNDQFLLDYIMDLRTKTNNELITAEHVDLASLHSIRQFATKWIDNAPPRRLDMIMLCANTMKPAGGKLEATKDGLEVTWGVNFIANFHLLSILSPALRAQPPDRDVRIIFGTCSSYMAGSLPDFATGEKVKGNTKKAGKTAPKDELNTSSVYGTSKLALMTFASAFQKHLDSYTRPDKQTMNTRVIMVDPGWTRTPGMRRHLSFGTILGLVLYVVTYPVWWLFLKNMSQGAQSFLFAAMEAHYGRGTGGKFIKECSEITFMKSEITDESAQESLWQASEKTVEILEKESARKRAQEKKSQPKRKADEETKAEPTAP